MLSDASSDVSSDTSLTNTVVTMLTDLCQNYMARQSVIKVLRILYEHPLCDLYREPVFYTHPDLTADYINSIPPEKSRDLGSMIFELETLARGSVNSTSSTNGETKTNTKTNYENNKCKTIQDVEDDLSLIFTNSITFNSEDNRQLINQASHLKAFSCDLLHEVLYLSSYIEDEQEHQKRVQRFENVMKVPMTLYELGVFLEHYLSVQPENFQATKNVVDIFFPLAVNSTIKGDRMYNYAITNARRIQVYGLRAAEGAKGGLKITYTLELVLRQLFKYPNVSISQYLKIKTIDIDKDDLSIIKVGTGYHIPPYISFNDLNKNKSKTEGKGRSKATGTDVREKPDMDMEMKMEVETKQEDEEREQRETKEGGKEKLKRLTSSTGTLPAWLEATRDNTCDHETLRSGALRYTAARELLYDIDRIIGITTVFIEERLRRGMQASMNWIRPLDLWWTKSGPLDQMHFWPGMVLAGTYAKSLGKDAEMQQDLNLQRLTASERYDLGLCKNAMELLQQKKPLLAVHKDVYPFVQPSNRDLNETEMKLAYDPKWIFRGENDDTNLVEYFGSHDYGFSKNNTDHRVMGSFVASVPKRKGNMSVKAIQPMPEAITEAKEAQMHLLVYQGINGRFASTSTTTSTTTNSQGLICMSSRVVSDEIDVTTFGEGVSAKVPPLDDLRRKCAYTNLVISLKRKGFTSEAITNTIEANKFVGKAGELIDVKGFKRKLPRSLSPGSRGGVIHIKNHHSSPSFFFSVKNIDFPETATKRQRATWGTQMFLHYMQNSDSNGNSNMNIANKTKSVSKERGEREKRVDNVLVSGHVRYEVADMWVHDGTGRHPPPLGGRVEFAMGNDTLDCQARSLRMQTLFFKEHKNREERKRILRAEMEDLRNYAIALDESIKRKATAKDQENKEGSAVEIRVIESQAMSVS
jgi:hypothetical protein